MSDVKGDGVENSVIKINEISNSTLEELTKLREALEGVLHPQEAKDTASEPMPGNQVKMVAEIERSYNTMIEARYIVRDILDRLAL